MKKYEDSIMGLVVGLVLMLLNNDIVHRSINSVLTLFNPNGNLSQVSILLTGWSWRIITIISFIGIIITITCSIIILKKVLDIKKF